MPADAQRRCWPHPARLGVLAFILRFGSALNAHLHFHCVVIDGAFAPTVTAGAVFYPATEIDRPAIATVQAKVRRRLLVSFVRRGLLADVDARAMAQWDHGGGFSVDASVRIEARRPCRARAAAGLLRPAAARPGTTARAISASTCLLSPRIEALQQWPADRHPTRTARPRRLPRAAAAGPSASVLWGAGAQRATTSRRDRDGHRPTPPAPVHSPPPAAEPESRRAARYDWARLLTRIYEVSPLLCPLCATPMRVVAFIADPTPVRAILAHLGEPIRPLIIAPTRGPPRRAAPCWR